MKAEQLKSSILQNAIEGKLVEEKNAGNSAKFLLDKIGERKGINLQHTSKNNSLNENNKSVVPFKIPDSWCWVKLSDISSIIIGKTPAKSEVDFWAFQDYKWVTIADMINGEVIYDTSLNISQEAYDRIFRGKIIKKGTLIMSFKLTIGKTSIMGFDGFHNEAIASIVPYYDEENTLRNYLLKILPLISQSGEFKGAIKGNTLNKKTLSNLPIPLPPLEDQKSIVEKLDEVFKVADKYDRLEKKIESLNNEFPLNMQKSILQYALEGKLVSQNPEEESAKSILRNLLLDNKKIEKISYEDNTPFKIPSSWEWVTLNDIAEKVHYGYTASAKEKGDAKLLRITDIQNNEVDWSSVPYCNIAEEAIEKYKLIDNDILIARTGGTIGKSYIIHTINETSVFASYLIRVQLSKHINPHFIKKFLESPLYWTQLKNMTAGTGQPNVNATNLKKLFIPIPPLREQARILEEISNFDYHIKNLNNSIF